MADQEVTRLLGELNRGNQAALDQLIPLIYKELRRIAAGYFERESVGHTLQPTAVVHEAFVRMAGQHVQWQNRAHFLGVAATMMRRVLLDYAKAKQANRRGGEKRQRVELVDSLAVTGNKVVELIAIDECLEKLAALDAQQARVVELRFFGGLSVEETSEVMGISAPTVKRYWSSARAFLLRGIRRGSDTGEMATGSGTV